MDKKEAIKIGVGAVIFKDDDVLLIKRGKAPFKGHWSIPGGRLEFGERLEAAALREVMEETGVTARICRKIDVFEALPEEAGQLTHVVMVDYWGEWIAGEPVAADDAADARFFALEEALKLLSWDETRRALEMAIALRIQAQAQLKER